ncbi:MAG: PIG-L family deacetylase [Mycobacterium sp.]|nr:PIG-L family deacetylase [Mycobacterium sp.]
MSHRPHPTSVLMMVHAHPDDESSLTGGTLARYSAAGVRTILVTCTDGAQGDAGPNLKPGSPSHDPRAVAAHRIRELDRAAEILGIHEVVKLGYPDSGTLEDAPGEVSANAFSRRPFRPIMEQMVRLMRLHRPDVVVTYPANGLSGHPDHVRTHDLVAAAHRNIIVDEETASDQSAQPLPWDPKLYYIALSRTQMREIQALARNVMDGHTWVPPDDMAINDTHVTTAIDVAAFWPHKLQALAAHASQGDAMALRRILTAADGTVRTVEEYVQAYPPPSQQAHVTQDDLFAPLTASANQVGVRHRGLSNTD